MEARILNSPCPFLSLLVPCVLAGRHPTQSSLSSASGLAVPLLVHSKQATHSGLQVYVRP